MSQLLFFHQSTFDLSLAAVSASQQLLHWTGTVAVSVSPVRTPAVSPPSPHSLMLARRSQVMSLNFHGRSLKWRLVFMPVLASLLFLFRAEIIHEGGQWVCLSSSLSSHPSSPGRCLSYHLLLGNNQEIYPVVCFFFFFFKGCNQGLLPRAGKGQHDRNLTVGVHHFDI